ncbi:MAG: DUF2505 domain-containing protein [Polyangiaceae bacterium]|nr:DUF2505 domain-containing protein [Polyangiaceae bacterium]
MKELNFSHVINCGIDTFWDQIFFDDTFNRELFHEKLKFVEWKDNVTKNTDKVLERTVIVHPPNREIPGAVSKLIGDNIGYKEFGKFDRATKRYHVEVETNMAKEKTQVRGDIWLERIDDTHSRRRTVFTIEVKIMVVGKLVEESIAKDMTKSFEEGAVFTNEWIKLKGL